MKWMKSAIRDNGMNWFSQIAKVGGEDPKESIQPSIHLSNFTKPKKGKE